MDATAFAHDLRAPLHVMLGHMQLLAVERLSDTGRERLGVLEAQIHRMIRLLDRCAEVQGQDRMPARAPVDVGALIRTVVSEVDALVLGGAIEIHADILAPLPRVHGDHDLLHRVLLNVLVNAVESMGGRGRIEIRAVAETLATAPVEAVHIDIADNGAGIPAGLITRVFEPGFSTKASVHGHGYGLAICREILDMHAGDIQVSSEPGRGTRVRVSLPVTA